MSRQHSITLKAAGRKVRCSSGRIYAVTIVADTEKLKVVKRTDSLATLKQYIRNTPYSAIAIFDLATGELIWGGDPRLRSSAAQVAVTGWHDRQGR